MRMRSPWPSRRAQTWTHTWKLYGLALCLLLSSASPGCRVGNHVESPPPAEPYTGYYLTQPQSLKLYITLNHETLTQAGNPSQIPKLISQYLTNPVLFLILDQTTGQAALADPMNTSKALPSHMITPGALNYSGFTQFKTHWDDSLCQSAIEVKELGQLNTGPGEAPPGFAHSVAGRLSLNVQVITQFKGDCGPTFQTLADCYANASLCGSTDPAENHELQISVALMFGPWIAAGMIQASDIAHIDNYAYEVVYE